MRIRGRVPICKTYRHDHELRIRRREQTHTTLLRKERKEVIHGQREIDGESRVEIPILRREKERLHLFGSKKN
jgi:hypothetical protein